MTAKAITVALCGLLLTFTAAVASDICHVKAYNGGNSDSNDGGSNSFDYQRTIVLFLPQEYSSSSRSSLLPEYRNNKNTNEEHHTVPKAKKLLHKTFRISEDVINALEKEAGARGVPVSNIVNQILRNSLQKEMQYEKSGFILTSKEFYRRMFSGIDEKSVEEYGRELGYAIVGEYAYSFFPDINNHTIIQFLESWFERFQSYQHRYDEENHRHNFSLNHDINMNFSTVLKIILQGLIEPVTKSPVIFGDLTSSAISFSFEV